MRQRAASVQLQCSAVQCSFSAMQCRVVQCSFGAMQCRVVQCSFGAMQCRVVQCSAVCHSLPLLSLPPLLRGGPGASSSRLHQHTHLIVRLNMRVHALCTPRAHRSCHGSAHQLPPKPPAPNCVKHNHVEQVAAGCVTVRHTYCAQASYSSRQAGVDAAQHSACCAGLVFYSNLRHASVRGNAASKRCCCGCAILTYNGAYGRALGRRQALLVLVLY